MIISFRQQKHANHERGVSATGTMLLIGIIILGIAVFADTESPAEPTISEVLAAHEQIDSVRFTGSLSADMKRAADTQLLPDSAADIVSADITSLAQKDSLLAELKFEGAITFGTSTTHRRSMTLLAGTSSASTTVAAVDVRNTASGQFVRMKDLATDNQRLKAITGRWYRLPSANAGSRAATQLLRQTPLSDAPLPPVPLRTLQTVLQTAADTELVAVNTVTKTRLQSGDPAYQFTFEITPDNLADFQRALPTATATADGASQVLAYLRSELTEEDLNKLADQLGTVRIWTGRKPLRVRRMQVKGTLSGAGTAALRGITAATTTLDVRFADYNQPVTITPPSDVQQLGQ